MSTSAEKVMSRKNIERSPIEDPPLDATVAWRRLRRYFTPLESLAILQGMSLRPVAVGLRVAERESKILKGRVAALMKMASERTLPFVSETSIVHSTLMLMNASNERSP